MAYNETPYERNAMLTLVAIVVTAFITTFINRKMMAHRLTDLKIAHRGEMLKETSKFHSAGFDAGRDFEKREQKYAAIKAGTWTEEV